MFEVFIKSEVTMNMVQGILLNRKTQVCEGRNDLLWR